MFEEIETHSDVPNFNVDDGVSIGHYKNLFSKGYTKNWSKNVLTILCWKLALGHIELKIYQVILLKRIKLSVDTSNLVTKKDFVALKGRIDKVDINEFC